MLLAERYHWPETLTREQEPEFIDELLDYIEALAEHQKLLDKRREREAKRK